MDIMLYYMVELVAHIKRSLTFLFSGMNYTLFSDCYR